MCSDCLLHPAVANAAAGPTACLPLPGAFARGAVWTAKLFCSIYQGSPCQEGNHPLRPCRRLLNFCGYDGQIVKGLKNLLLCRAEQACGEVVFCCFFENPSFVSHDGGTNFYARNNQQNHGQERQSSFAKETPLYRTPYCAEKKHGLR